MSLLSAEAFYFRDGDTLNANTSSRRNGFMMAVIFFILVLSSAATAKNNFADYLHEARKVTATERDVFC